jgi:hypothetical protein
MNPNDKDRDEDNRGVHIPETTPAQERGERIDTGKSIARGGKEVGTVPGAEDRGTPGEHVQRKAVLDALNRLGRGADTTAVIAEVRTREHFELTPDEVTALRRELGAAR